MNDLFAGKVVIVTGGAAGIGSAAAELFARHGAKVTVSDIDAEAGGGVVEAICSAGGDAIYIGCDVSDPDSVRLLVAETVARFGRLDCAFNNAGVVLEADNDWDDAAFDRTMAINVTGVMQCMKAQIPEIRKSGGGAIVNTASINGLISSVTPSLPAYTASKHAVIGLTKTAALRHARENIRVNALCPGVTATAMVRRVAELGPEVRARIENLTPMGRMGTAEEMAEAAIWLCSDRSSYVTGHALVVDGGRVIQ